MKIQTLMKLTILMLIAARSVGAETLCYHRTLDDTHSALDVTYPFNEASVETIKRDIVNLGFKEATCSTQLHRAAWCEIDPLFGDMAYYTSEKHADSTLYYIIQDFCVKQANRTKDALINSGFFTLFFILPIQIMYKARQAQNTNHYIKFFTALFCTLTTFVFFRSNLEPLLAEASDPRFLDAVWVSAKTALFSLLPRMLMGEITQMHARCQNRRGRMNFFRSRFPAVEGNYIAVENPEPGEQNLGVV